MSYWESRRLHDRIPSTPDSWSTHIGNRRRRPAAADASASADAGTSGVAVGRYSTATDCDCPARVVDARVVRAADARSVALAGSRHNAAAYVNGAARAGDTCVGLAGINRVRLSARCTVCSDSPHL